MLDHVWLIPFIPAASFVAILFLGKRLPGKGAETVERSIKARGRRIYVDYMQNVLGKTLASAYSARASEFAGVSTPLTWDEVEEGVSPRDFTVATFPQRMKETGDIWAGLRKAKPADLRSLRQTTEARRPRGKK